MKKILKKLKKAILNPKLVLLYLLNKEMIARIFSDKMYLKIKYRLTMGKKLNLNSPQTFNEKLQWLKLYNRNSEYAKMVDKYEVRKYIADKIGEEYLIPILGVWDSPDEIDFDKLPNQFVLKCTHDSGGLIICKDKSKLNIKITRKKINKCLKRNYFWQSREWPYKNVKPRIVAEKYMVDESGTELKDYKIFCFDGKVSFIEVDFNRFVNHKRNFYTREWDFINAEIQYPNDININIERPILLEKMIEFAERLSFGMPHARIDFYSINEDIYFGEITFFHESGMGMFKPEKWDYKWGEMIKL